MVLLATIPGGATAWSQTPPTTVYVSDTNIGAVLKFDEGGQSTTFASGLNTPTGLAFDTQGNLYVADQANQTINKYNSSGTKSVFASSGYLYQPEGLAFDSKGVLYVANAGANTMEIRSDGRAAFN